MEQKITQDGARGEPQVRSGAVLGCCVEIQKLLGKEKDFHEQTRGSSGRGVKWEEGFIEGIKHCLLVVSMQNNNLKTQQPPASAAGAAAYLALTDAEKIQKTIELLEYLHAECLVPDMAHDAVGTCRICRLLKELKAPERFEQPNARADLRGDKP
jgi:hypothetical protein